MTEQGIDQENKARTNMPEDYLKTLVNASSTNSSTTVPAQ